MNDRAFVTGALLLVSAAAPSPAAALQAPDQDAAWNDARVTALIERARETRVAPLGSGVMESYSAEARGHVYFYLDREDSPDHVLVKADQVALELYWRSPDETKQRIVGQRDERVLPTDIRYHLDHLTVVQDDFGDRIRLGDGDEVGSVVHPVSQGSSGVYDFRLSDSVTIAYGQDEQVRVYEVQVRPKAFDRPGFVGTVFVDRDNAAIVRMNFSFTPASYADGQLDYIRVSLDNALWMGTVWLPYRQEVELRRETRLLDVSVGSVIRSRFSIHGYDFDRELSDQVFAGGSLSVLPLSRRREFQFEGGVLDEVEEEGLTTSTTMEDVRAEVREVVGNRGMSGLSPIRLNVAGFSDFVRYNRAEGTYVGAGLTLRPRGDMTARPALGYAFGRDEGTAKLAVGFEGASTRQSVDLYWNRLGDIGGHPGAEPLVNTISAASGDEDFLDPFFRSGVSLGLSAPDSRWRVGLTAERQLSARDVVSDASSDFRPVLSVTEGTLVAGEVRVATGLPGRGEADLTVEGGSLEGTALAKGTVSASWTIGRPLQGPFSRVSTHAGIANPGAPPQALFLIGGRHTLPGHDYRSFVGHAYWLTRVEATVPLRAPWVGLRAIGVVGATRRGSVTLPADWSLTDTNGLRGSVGLGLSIAWNTVHLDVAHGVRGGGWEAVFAVSERFRDWM